MENYAIRQTMGDDGRTLPPCIIDRFAEEEYGRWELIRRQLVTIMGKIVHAVMLLRWTTTYKNINSCIVFY